MKLPLAVAAATILALPLAACAPDSGAAGTGSTGSTGAISVTAEIYPFAWFAEQVGGNAVKVTTLVPPGSDVHGFEVSPKQVAELSDADLVIYTDGTAAAVDKAVESAKPGRVIDAATLVKRIPAPTRHAEDGHAEDEHAEDEHAEDEHAHGSLDPHTWLALDQMPAVVDAIAADLGAIAPDRAKEFTTNAATLKATLADLDKQYRAGLASCAHDTIVVTHPAFGYLAHAYGLGQLGISGFDEDTEPSPARIAEVGAIAKKTGATTIFLANSSNPKVADVLAADLDLKTGVLFTLAAPVKQQDYVAMAKANLTALKDGLGCS